MVHNLPSLELPDSEENLVEPNPLKDSAKH